MTVVSPAAAPEVPEAREPLSEPVRPKAIWRRATVIVLAAVAGSGGLCFALYPLIGIPLFPPGAVGQVLLWAPLVTPMIVGPACIVPLERTRARLAAEAANRRIVQAQLEEMARRDPLTGLLNRRGFFEIAQQGLERGATLVTVDVDDFKQVNDGFGHRGGDAALQQLAAALEEAAGEDGVAARVGGDEFVLLVPADQGERLEQLHMRLAGLAVVLDGGARVTVSASVGVTAIAAGEGIDEALARADQVMYWHKGSRKRGRSA